MPCSSSAARTLGFLLGLGVGRDRKVQVRHSHVLGDAGVIRVVRHDEAEIHRQFAAAPTGEQVVEAVGLLRGHDRRRCRSVGEAEVDGHAEAFGGRSEGVDDLISFEAEPVEVELDALEEHGVAVARPASTCCSACTMLPSWSARNCAVAATTPGWSGHESNRTAVTALVLPSNSAAECVARHGGRGSGVERVDAGRHRDAHRGGEREQLVAEPGAFGTDQHVTSGPARWCRALRRRVPGSSRRARSRRALGVRRRG